MKIINKEWVKKNKRAKRDARREDFILANTLLEEAQENIDWLEAMIRILNRVLSSGEGIDVASAKLLSGFMKMHFDQVNIPRPQRLVPKPSEFAKKKVRMNLADLLLNDAMKLLGLYKGAVATHLSKQEPKSVVRGIGAIGNPSTDTIAYRG